MDYYRDFVSKEAGVLSLHFYDDDGPIWIYLPKAGVDHMCGRKIPDKDVKLLLDTHHTELYPLIDRACERNLGFTLALWQNGAAFRKLTITLDDVKNSGIRLSTEALATAEVSGPAV